MTEEALHQCLLSVSRLLDVSYRIVLGKAGHLLTINLDFQKYDFHHLLGLHYLTDRPDRRSRSKIFDDLILSAEYRKYIASSDLWNKNHEDRILCVQNLEQLLDDNQTIFRYNAHANILFSRIRAEYLLANSSFHLSSTTCRDIYIFLDKRPNCDIRYCKSVFPKTNMDYTKRQPIWTLLYKTKQYNDGSVSELFRHHRYTPPPDQQ